MRTTLTILSVLMATVLLSAPAFADDDAGGGAERGGKRHHARKARRRLAKIFKKFDKNEDGALSSDEVPAKLWTRLAKADADGDGSVTKAELKAFAKARRGKHRGKHRGKRGGGDGGEK